MAKGNFDRFVVAAHSEKSAADLQGLDVDALSGVSASDADHLKEAFGIETIADLASNRFFAAARAIVEEAANIDHDPDRPIPTAVDQSAFRIIQEALTNTLKHAGPTTATVDVRHSETSIELEVRDHGPHSSHRHRSPVGHSSQGIVGMRERATILDGDLDVGPTSSGGYRVAARLPLTTSERT